MHASRERVKGIAEQFGGIAERELPGEGHSVIRFGVPLARDGGRLGRAIRCRRRR